MGGNFFKGAIALGVIAGIMGFTNPPQELYSEYAAEKLLAHADKIACEKISLCDSIDSLPVAARNIIKNQILKPAIVSVTRSILCRWQPEISSKIKS